MKRLITTLLLAACGMQSASSAAAEAAPVDTAQNVRLQWAVKIPLRDGVKLNATVYLPRESQAPAPCIFTLTPYISDTYHSRGLYFAAHGYPFATVDARGRGNSEGTFRPNIQEAKDGYDVVEWFARQSYCNGKVAMWGGSYAGYNQWATAKEFPPHLGTIVPAAAGYMGYDVPMRNNIFIPFFLQWLTYTGGKSAQFQIFGDSDFWAQINREWYVSGRPFRELDAMFGNPSATLQEWLDHPEPDAYWDEYNPTADHYAALKIPVLTITGAYDGEQPGALEHYRRHLRSAPSARESHYLIIGPWDHGGTRTPRAEAGGVKFGPASLLDLGKLHLDWYAWTLGSGAKPEFLKKPVAYYVTGAERWKYADSLEAATSRTQPLILGSATSASDVLPAGQLKEGPGTGKAGSYYFDPRDVTGPEIDVLTKRDPESLTDQSLLLALRGKSLIYHSTPFEQDTEISGFFQLSAWIAIDTPDTDFYVSVHEIAPDGSSIQLATDALRARYREGLRSPKLISTREPLLYDFNRFTFVSRVLKRGSRLRLVIAPMGTLTALSFSERNFNGGGVVAAESVRDARPVTVRLYSGRSRPSTLFVPLGRPADQ
jgi:uncharacterized protein